ncbi:MAG: hypothetical protein P1V97_24010 [Planctomycetota bacterium]|nr:hypothetical protein [Planctomycetota bacterium]
MTKYLKKFFGVFGGELSPLLVTYGFCLGLFFGFMPQGSDEFVTVILLCLLLFTRQSYGFMLISAGLSKAFVALGPWQWVAKTGRAALETESLVGFWQSVLDTPGIRLLFLERYIAMGGFLWALIGSILCFGPCMILAKKIRVDLLPKADKLPLVGPLASGWVGWFVKLLFFGVRPIDTSAEAIEGGKAPTPGDEAVVVEGKPMKNPGLVYWRLFIPFMIALFIAETFYGGPIVAHYTTQAGRDNLKVNIILSKTKLSLMGGNVHYDGFSAKRNDEDFVNLDSADLDFNMGDLLKGSVVIEEARFTNPEFRWIRDPNDRERLVKAAQDAMGQLLEELTERIKKLDEYGKEEPNAEPEPSDELDKLSPEDRALMGKASYLRKQPGFWLQRLIIDGLTVSFEDRVSGADELQLNNAHLEMDNITTDPGLIDAPFGMVLTARIGHVKKPGEAPNSKIKITLVHDIKTNITTIDLNVSEIPVEWLDAYIEKSMPLIFFGSTRANLGVTFVIKEDMIEANPRIALKNIQCRVRNPSKKTRILGVEAKKLSRELNTVKNLELNDIRLYGSIDNPSIDFGTTITSLSKQYALAKGRAEADKAVDKADVKVNKELNRFDKRMEKELGRHGVTGPGSKDVINKITGGKGTKGTANDILDGVQKGAGSVFDGMFGTGKKKTPKKETEKKPKKKKGLLDDLFGG